MLVVGLLAPAGCGDEQDALRAENLIGTWTATRLEFTGTASPHVKVDVIQEGGAFAITFFTDYRYESSLSRWNLDEPRARTGSWELADGALLLIELAPASTMNFDAELSGESLTLTKGLVEYDFLGHGIFEAATLVAVLARP
jgi:hypothetical protein